MMPLKPNTLIWIAVVAILSSFVSITDTITNKITVSLQNGDAKEVSKYFNSNVELVIIEKEGIYSKNQAEYILIDFFKHNTPSSYIKLHEGGKEASKFVIGQLKTAKGTFRIYFLIKNIDGTMAIHQFRIENEN